MRVDGVPEVACECGEPELDAEAAVVCHCCRTRFDDPGPRACDCCRPAPTRPRARPGPASQGRGRRNGNRYSTVFTLRIGHEDLAALHRQAAEYGVRPSVLARSLIRHGLATQYEV